MKKFLEKYNFDKDTEIYSNHSCYADSWRRMLGWKMHRFGFRKNKKTWWIYF